MSVPEIVNLSRAQFAMTAIFHILWPILTISLSAFLLLVETLWVRTNDVMYYRHARFWAKLLVLNFAVGVVSGIPMEFQFGTDWEGFSRYTGEFFGNILGFEGAMAFMLEAGFIGVMLYGWGRVPRGVHLFATGMVAFGATLSAFWIMVANSWMQTPAGVSLSEGKLVVTDYVAAIFNPDMIWGVGHMWVAALETGAFVIAGISAFYLYRRRHPEFFLRSFKLALAALLVIAPLQIWLGDSSGVDVFHNQPAKGAAIEGYWHTNAPGGQERLGTAGMARPGAAKKRLGIGAAQHAQCIGHPQPDRQGHRVGRYPACRPTANACPCCSTRSGSWPASASGSCCWPSGARPCGAKRAANCRPCWHTAHFCSRGY